MRFACDYWSWLWSVAIEVVEVYRVRIWNDDSSRLEGFPGARSLLGYASRVECYGTRLAAWDALGRNRFAELVANLGRDGK